MYTNNLFQYPIVNMTDDPRNPNKPNKIINTCKNMYLFVKNRIFDMGMGTDTGTGTNNKMYSIKHDFRTLFYPPHYEPPITDLTIDSNNYHTIELTVNIKVLMVKRYHGSPLVLTPNIEKITFCFHYFQHITIPKYLKKLIIYRCENYPIILNRYIHHLGLYHKYDQPTMLSKTIHIIWFDDFNNPIDLNKHAQMVQLGDVFNRRIFLTKNLTHVVFGKNFKQSIVLNKKIMYLKLSCYYNGQIILKPYIKCLVIGQQISKTVIEYPIERLHILTNGYKHDYLPNGSSNVVFGDFFEMRLDNLPTGLKGIEIHNSHYKHNFPNV